jgi:hypothetical protein
MPMPKKQSQEIGGVVCWRCSGCMEWRPGGDFGRDSGNSNGLKSRCRRCHNDRAAAYRAANPGKVRAATMAWRRENADAIKSYGKQWARENRDKVRANGRRRYLKNKDEVLRERKQYRDDCPEKRAAQSAVRYAIKRGELTRPSICETCGNESDRPIHAHHESYNKEHWLDVMWLCGTCHKRHHCGR